MAKAMHKTHDTIDTSNYVFLAMTAHHWGSSKTSGQEAVKALRNYCGSRWFKDHGYILYRVHPKFRIGEVDGTIYTPKDHPPIEVERKLGPKAKLTA